MKKAYRMFKRKDRENYYIQNNATREQRCLFTSDRQQAQRILDTENQARQTPALNLQLGKVYITNADPKMTTRTWQEAMNEFNAKTWRRKARRAGDELKRRIKRPLRQLEFFPFSS